MTFNKTDLIYFYAIPLVIFLSVATLLRFPFLHLPFGIAEMAVLFGLVCKLRAHHIMQFIKSPFVLFWFGFLLVLLVGYKVNYAVGASTLHTAVAYCFDLLVTFTVLLWFANIESKALQKVIRNLLIISTVAMFGSCIIYLFSSELSNFLLINTYSERFAAWSANPNQLALLLVPFPIFLLLLYPNAALTIKKISFIGLALFFFFLMALTIRSDGLLLSWTFGFIVILFFSFIFKIKINIQLYSILFLSFILAFLSYKLISHYKADIENILASVVLASNISHADLNNESKENIKVLLDATLKKTGVTTQLGEKLILGGDPQKTNIRKTLWLHGLKVWQNAPLFGYGPGAFSYLKESDSKIEAHNLIIDILTQSGLIGLTLFLSLIIWLTYKIILSRDVYALTILGMLLVFSQAHFTLRQPIFIFYLILCAIGDFARIRNNKVLSTE